MPTRDPECGGPDRWPVPGDQLLPEFQPALRLSQRGQDDHRALAGAGAEFGPAHTKPYPSWNIPDEPVPPVPGR